MKQVLGRLVFFATIVLKVIPAIIEALDAYEKSKPAPKAKPTTTTKRVTPTRSEDGSGA